MKSGGFYEIQWISWLKTYKSDNSRKNFTFTEYREGVCHINSVKSTRFHDMCDKRPLARYGEAYVSLQVNVCKTPCFGYFSEMRFLLEQILLGAYLFIDVILASRLDCMKLIFRILIRCYLIVYANSSET